jgi:hypothetical protein
MRFSAVDNLLWIGGFIPTAALMIVLLWRGRWRQFPVLTSYMFFTTVRTIILFAIYMHGSTFWYRRIFWSAACIEFFLQLSVAIEIARIVLRPTGTWVRDARLQFAVVGLAGAAVAAAMVWWVSPPADSALIAWRIRGNLFTSLVICELFVAMSFTANRLGLGWRNHVMAVGQGLTAWSAVTVVTTALQSFFGQDRYYHGIDHFRILAWTVTIAWIVVQLWVPEPERQPIAPDLQHYILALHRRVEYDLRRLDAGD